jgi:hypothetical protein
MNRRGRGLKSELFDFLMIQPARFSITDLMCSKEAATGAATKTPSNGSTVISIVFLRRRLRVTP